MPLPRAQRPVPAPTPGLRRVAAALALAAFASVALLPGGAGQGHDHAASASIAIAHDAPADGRTFVGNVNHFAVVAHGDDAIPDFHQDIPWRVTFNGVTLVETTPNSGHDYDGVNAFDIVFPAAGAYTVEALDESGDMVAMFEGTVVEDRGILAGTALAAEAEGSVSAGALNRFEFWPYAAGSEDVPIAHSDCTFEVVRADRVEFRTKAHTHEEKQVVEYAFPEAGDYTVRVLCYQAYSSPRATLFQPQLLEVGFQVLQAPLSAAGGLAAPPMVPPTDMNAVVTASAGDMTLVGTFDPYTQVGPDTLQHLNVLAVDATGQTIQHVDFTATLDGPMGRIYSSETLHEYDGIYELTTRQSVPGVYTLHATAEGAKGAGELTMSYTVVPRAVPLSAGLVAIDLDASPVTGTPGDWLLTATATSGAFAHGELEIRLTAEGSAIPFLQTKLHTHDDGLYPFTVALPTQEPYALAVTPFPLTPDLVLPAPATFQVEPAPGSPLATDPDADATDDVQREMPALPAVLALAALGLAAAASRRRA